MGTELLQGPYNHASSPDIVPLHSVTAGVLAHLVPLVVRMHGDGSVSQHGLNTSGGYHYLLLWGREKGE